jgi:hypothetical protein
MNDYYLRAYHLTLCSLAADNPHLNIFTCLITYDTVCISGGWWWQGGGCTKDPVSLRFSCPHGSTVRGIIELHHQWSWGKLEPSCLYWNTPPHAFLSKLLGSYGRNIPVYYPRTVFFLNILLSVCKGHRTDWVSVNKYLEVSVHFFQFWQRWEVKGLTQWSPNVISVHS